MPTSKETGILFTPENIRAIRNDRKFQTRRVIKVKGNLDYASAWDNNRDTWVPLGNPENSTREYVSCPYGVSGDRLYIKEGIIIHADRRTLAGYYMDGARVTNLGEKRLTAMFMPKRMARTWLEITDVRVERLQEISEEDAQAEGCSPKINDGLPDWTAKESFQILWESINKKTHPWSSNPWVWAITFKCIQQRNSGKKEDVNG